MKVAEGRFVTSVKKKRAELVDEVGIQGISYSLRYLSLRTSSRLPLVLTIRADFLRD